MGPSTLRHVAERGKDSFEFSATPQANGALAGALEHTDHGTGNKLSMAAPTYLVCRKVDGSGPDPNQAYFGGPARWFT